MEKHIFVLLFGISLLKLCEMRQKGQKLLSTELRLPVLTCACQGKSMKKKCCKKYKKGKQCRRCPKR